MHAVNNNLVNGVVLLDLRTAFDPIGSLRVKMHYMIALVVPVHTFWLLSLTRRGALEPLVSAAIKWM